MSFFKRKESNRRLGGRGELLEVKARSSLVRAKRMRLGAMMLGVAFGTVFLLYLAWRTTNWALDKFLYQNPAFAIHQIEVYTDGVISPEQIRRWAGVKPGQNLLALELSNLKRDLELVPFIKLAAVERVLPHTLRIRVIEREPLAQVYVPQAGQNGQVEMRPLYLDEDGYVLAPLKPWERANPTVQSPEQYPVLLGIQAGELMPGNRLDLSVHTGVQAALQLIVAFDRSPMLGLDSLQQIDVSAPDVLEVKTARGSRITFSVHNIERQLRRWREIYELGQRLNRTIGSVDLAVADNIPVRWAEPNPAQPAGQNQLKPSSTRKRNV